MFEGHSKIHTCKVCSKIISVLSKLKEQEKTHKPVKECPKCYRKLKRVGHHQTRVAKSSEFLPTFVDISRNCSDNFSGGMLQENLATSEISEKDTLRGLIFVWINFRECRSRKISCGLISRKEKKNNQKLLKVFKKLQICKELLHFRWGLIHENVKSMNKKDCLLHISRCCFLITRVIQNLERM